uniref:Lipoprotein signal peptidase n=1 Tax=Candidatus Caldatribacterium californiense TaxID=1454726 RepID=A0A7V3YNE9_9BACT
MGKIAFFLLWFLGVLCDQITKWWAEERLQEAIVPVVSRVLELRLRKNFASAFGLQFLDRPQHVVVTVGVTIFLLLALFSGRHSRSLPFFLGGSLYLAGAWGNLIDRLWRGYVVDFIEPSFWATFNVADIFIVAGVIGIVWGFLRREERKDSGL